MLALLGRDTDGFTMRRAGMNSTHDTGPPCKFRSCLTSCCSRRVRYFRAVSVMTLRRRRIACAGPDHCGHTNQA